MSFASTSSRFHSRTGPIGRRFHAEASALWTDGEIVRRLSLDPPSAELDQADGKERLEATNRKAEALTVDPHGLPAGPDGAAALECTPP
jgi:hypothetical protein